MDMPDLKPTNAVLDVICETDGTKVFAELDVTNNDKARIGDQYAAKWADGSITVMRVIGFKSAEDYGKTVARRIDAMRERVAGVPTTITARKAYQVKIAELIIEGELLPDGSRRLGASRVPDVMVPISRMDDATLETFATAVDGNLILGNLRSGSRVLNRLARISHNYAGNRMVVFGMPGKGKTQLIRSVLSQAMSEGVEESQ